MDKGKAFGKGRDSNTEHHNHERADVNWKNTLQKSKAVGFFARHISDKSRQRLLLTQFMHGMKKQKDEDKPELDSVNKGYEHAETASNIRTLRPKSPEELSRPIPNPDAPSWKPYEVPPGCKCGLCGIVFPAFHEHEAIPCRVCNDVFHQNCLEKCGDLNSSDKSSMHKAKTNIGWSCPDCANISLLLSIEEVQKMTDAFEAVDINQDGKISITEYLRFHSRRKSLSNSRGQLLSSEQDRLTQEFRFMDQNGDNMLDWWEFVNHESKIFLAKMDKHELVHMLTEKELIASKATFAVLDKDGDGNVKEYEAIFAYKKWFRQKLSKFTNQESEVESDSELLDRHATMAARLIMGADSSKDGNLQWNDFILDQALYIICGRPNMNTDLNRQRKL